MCTELDEVLTPYQRKQLARILKILMDTEHGEVRIRVQKGRVRFISVTLEEDFALFQERDVLKSLQM